MPSPRTFLPELAVLFLRSSELLRPLSFYGKRGVLRRGEKGPYGRSSKKPTVGRDDDLPWVASTTYSRFLRGGIRGPYIIYGVSGLRPPYMSGRKHSPPDPKELL